MPAAGEAGVELLFQYSVSLHGPQTGKMEVSDSTVQENNVTFPTDSKLVKKVIDKCNALAKRYGMVQRQRYTRRAKAPMLDVPPRITAFS